MSFSSEDSYIKNIDSQRQASLDKIDGIDDIGLIAEDVIIDFLNKFYAEQITVRHSTKEEDSGLKQILQGLRVDAVVYDKEGVPIMCMQITVSESRQVRKEKSLQLFNQPFVRLPESKHSIPKVLVEVSSVDVRGYLKDEDFSKHPNIGRRIRETITASLLFILSKTQIKKEQEEIQVLIAMFKKDD